MRKKVSATIDTELVDWVDEKVKDKIYRSRSHAIEFALLKLKEAQARKN